MHGASVICINYCCLNFIYRTRDGAGKYKFELLLLKRRYAGGVKKVCMRLGRGQILADF